MARGFEVPGWSGDKEKTMENFIGKFVIIRDNMAGVYAGTLVSLDLAAGTWALTGARQAHWWAKAAATPGLAVTGPGRGSRIGPVVDIVGRTLVSVIPAKEAREVWASAPVWTP